MYCTEEQFTARFGEKELEQLLPGEGAGPKEETGRTYEAAAADADAIIDSYLAARGGITLPLSEPVPARILELAADLTRYKLYDDVRHEEKPSAIVARYNAAIAFLRDVSRGLAAIPGLTPDPVSGDTIEVYAKDRLFTDETLCGF